MNKSMLKKAVIFGLAGVMAVAAGCGSNKDAGNANSNEAKIALLTTTTGGAAAYGESIKAGAELAVSEINADANAVKINLLVEDTKGDKNDGDYIFRNAVPESLAVDTAIKEAHKTLGFKTAAIMYSNNNDQMVSVNNTARKALESEGVQIVDTETFADKDTDFSAQLTKIQQAKPDVIVVASLYQEGALIMKKMREMGMNQPVVGSNGFNSPEFIKIAGAAADGVIVGTPWFPNKDDQKVKDFRKAYKDKYGKEPDQFAAQAYDAVYLYEAALKKAGSTTDREKFREALKNIADFVGVTGQFKFNEKRDPSMEVQVLQIKNGQFDALKK
ncbi:MAG: ABC transporter substrate-binding protein [Veillonella sp.]|nr:ABC transporter substrate-binding protein [Veillonella sp.]